MVECECSCGTVKQVRKYDLKRGVSKSCGCFMRDEVVKRNYARITHRKRDTRIYHIWKGMKQRCYYPKHKWFSRYGGRGITVCDAWQLSFMAFYNWAMENGYEEHLTLDRRDNDGNYNPTNCRWVTQSENNANRSSS